MNRALKCGEEFEYAEMGEKNSNRGNRMDKNTLVETTDHIWETASISVCTIKWINAVVTINVCWDFRGS